MKKEAIAKSATTRKMNQLAGARRPLPGHDHNREAFLRALLTESFEPVGAVEMIWVIDIAGCMATIEVIRAQIAGRQHRMIEQALEHAVSMEKIAEDVKLGPGFSLSDDERYWLEAFAGRQFTAYWNKTYLDNPVFASLLSYAKRGDLELLRLMQQMLQSETRERDRIINQIDRRRRDAMRDAIELAEEARRAEIFRRLSSQEQGAGAAAGKVSAKRIASPTDKAAVRDADSGSADEVRGNSGE